VATERRTTLAAPLAWGAALLLSIPALAHDVWIEPSSYRPAPGEAIEVRLLVGERFAGEPVARNPARILDFSRRDARGRTPIPGAPGAEPSGAIRAGQTPGLERLVYRSRPARIDLPAAKFAAYLEAEGLDAVLAERARRGEAEGPGREAYSRCVQAFLAVGGGGGAGHDAGFGCEYELRPLLDPTRLAADATLEVEARFLGEPLAGARVDAFPRGAPERAVSGRTDGDGRLTLRLVGGGPWLVRSLHLVRAAPDANYEWRSYWSTLTFATVAVP